MPIENYLIAFGCILSIGFFSCLYFYADARVKVNEQKRRAEVSKRRGEPAERRQE